MRQASRPAPRGVALALCGAGALAGCTIGQDYRPPAASTIGVPATYSAAGDARTGDMRAWWRAFDDPLLTAIVERARAGNLDVAQAVARLRRAREDLIQSRAQLLPEIGGSAGYSRARNLRGGASTVVLPDGTASTIGAGGDRSSLTIGVDVSYQVGLFGEVRRTVEASRAQYEASGYDYATVLNSIEAETARNYILARLYQAQLASARDSLAIQQDNLEIAGYRVQAGIVSSLDSEQARASRAQTAATIPAIEQNLAAAVARLGVLTGQAPGALRGAMAEAMPIPVGPGDVAIGIPADTLRQRPDVRAAERQLAAATARIGVAEAQLLPSLAITGSVNAQSNTLAGVFDTITGSLFAGLTQAIFNAGRLRSQVRGQRAAAQGALALYKATVLAGIEDVEDAAAALAAARRRAADYALAYDAANNTAILGRGQYRAGLTDFTTLNVAEASLLSARNGLSQARADEATALVQLYLSLGGGWTPGAAPQAPESR